MRVSPTAIEGVRLIEPRVFEDDRGDFSVTWNAADFAAVAPGAAFVQDNHSRSGPWVLRGLHLQNPQPQGKLVRVVAGAVFDVLVDLRRSSPTFGRWEGFEISAANRRMVWAPEGLAHGFLALGDGADLLYKVTAPYAPEHEQAIAWNDPDLAVAWPLPPGVAPRLSLKDAAGVAMRDAATFP